MRADQLTRFAPEYSLGYRRLLDGGAVYGQCRYLQGPNETAPGHAVLATGAYGHRNGIAANTWWSPRDGRDVYAVEDSTVRIVGRGDTLGRGCGSVWSPPVSPRSLLAQTLGDALWQQTAGRGRIVSITGKDRSAVLMGGAHGQAFWPDECTGRLVSSSYYFASEDLVPDWVRAFNRDLPPARWWGRRWVADRPAPLPPGPAPLKPSTAPAFDHPLRGSNDHDPRFVSSFLGSPFAEEWVLAAAESAVTGLELGSWESSDLLWVGLSAHDMVGHDYGPESPEARDMCRREDHMLGDFMDFLDRRVGIGQWVMALSADHGCAVMPEDSLGWVEDPETIDLLRPHDHPGDSPVPEDPARRARFPYPARMMMRPFLDAADSVTASLGGPAGHWRWWDPYLDFVPDSARGSAPLPETLLRPLRADLTARFPVARMFLRSELRDTSATRDPLLRPARLAFYEPRAGDFYFIPDPGILPTFSRRETRHGAPYGYDNHVPLVFYGPGVRAADHSEPVSPADLAPTLGARLGIGAPAQAEGHALSP